MGGTVPVEIRDSVFDVRTGGPEKGPAVLLLHGFPENATMWDGVAPALHAAGLRTVAPDQRGYSPGARPAAVADYAMRHVVADTLGLLDALGLDAVHVLGHDWGAAVAWHLAGRHPQRVRTLTAVSVPHPAAHAHALHTDPDQQQRSGYITVFRRPDAEQLLLADDARRLRRMLRPLPDATVDAFVRPLAEPGALTGPLNWYRAMSGADLDGLGPVTVPTTYVWGTEDIAVGRAAAAACAGHVDADYRFVALPGVGHWVPELEPGTVAREALARISGPR
ncbi:MAG TPA: alpha/beta hydrolase [Mycobacteriales bacterium]|nr:alpha/beta hydrolase [Mycobacteriales bacterium]